MHEKTIARRVCQVFGQTVCGFDLLRANGKSYVIDVNGWSFVKGNQEYYDASARIIREIFLKEIRKRGKTLIKQPILSENQWKIKAYMSVMRHGDRTPKQKVKFTFNADLFGELIGDGDEEIVFKQEAQFQKVMKCINRALEGNQEDDRASLEQIINILSAKGKLPGTKVQLRPLIDKKTKRIPTIQLIIKWGGLFTHAGIVHSRELGNALRTDLNILNKDLIADIQVLSSSEKRVIDTAQTFCIALLQQPLDSDFILVTKEMLDDSNAAKEQTDAVKQKLQFILNPEFKVTPPREFVMPTGWIDFSGPVQELVDFLKVIRGRMEENLKVVPKESVWCCYETPFLFKERWEKLFRDFCDVERSKFEPSKISELYDALKFDILHNREYLSQAVRDLENDNVPYAKNMIGILWKKVKGGAEFSNGSFI
jgi:inositol hexakisphosphate/diphosphoinositol-pentakisphosphate kinase